MTAEIALERLREGNRRFVSGVGRRDAPPSPARRDELVEGQAPFAVILGCSDSRVPVEIVFDQGLGDLFVIRVAGNVVAPSQIGSVEFAAERFGTRLAVVMGHSGCGAVQATIDHLLQPPRPGSPHFGSIIDRIRPSVQELLATDLVRDPVELARRSVRANVRASVDRLRHGSEVLERAIHDDGLLVVGAHYSLETGEVEFLDNQPRRAPA